MWSVSLLFWFACAIVFFWALGAYNRLVRLRAAVRNTFAALDEQLLRQIVWVQGSVPADMRGLVTMAGEAEDAAEVAWRRLYAASEQFAVALAQVRANTIDGTSSASLFMAHSAMAHAWEGALREAVSPDDEVPADRLQARWVALLHEALPLQDVFNRAVETYNAAIGQFPAVILAKMVGFRPAGLIGRLVPDHLSDTDLVNERSGV